MSAERATAGAAHGAGPPTIAVMQPYFYPYPGYFRLLAAADIFVIFDDVQFPRRGRVHRCEVQGPGGSLEWLTLPLARQPRDILIEDLLFAPNARGTLDRRLGRLPWLAEARGPWADRLRAHLYGPLDGVLPFLEAGIKLTAEALQLAPQLLRSSSIAIDPALRGQDRVVAVVKALGGRTYINAPSGRALYDADAFAKRGIELRFLTLYTGERASILPTLVSGNLADMREKLLHSTELAAV